MAQFRLAIFLVLGMLTMQSEASWAVFVKGVYLPLVTAFFFVSLYNLRDLSPHLIRAFKPTLISCAVLFTYVTLVAWTSIALGEGVPRVLRDYFTYFLIVASPILGIDAGRHCSIYKAKVMLCLFTGVAAISFAVFWISARGASIYSFDRLFMYSMVLAGLGIMVGGIYGMLHLSVKWLAFTVACLLAILVTGTRTGLFLILGLLGGLGSSRNLRVPIPRFIVGFFTAAGLALLSLPVIAGRVTERGFIEKRITALTDVLEGDIADDASGAIRARAFHILYSEWREHPLFGTGFGHAFQSPTYVNRTADFQLDSGMLLLAKFGLLGSLILITCSVLFVLTFYRFHRHAGRRSEMQAVGVAFFVMILVLLPFGAPTEDKGFAFSLALMFQALTAYGIHVGRRRQHKVYGNRQVQVGDVNMLK